MEACICERVVVLQLPLALPGHVVDEVLGSVLREEVGPELLITADSRPGLLCGGSCRTTHSNQDQFGSDEKI